MVVVAVVMKLPQGRAVRMSLHPHPPQSKQNFALQNQRNSCNVNEFTFCNASQVRFFIERCESGVSFTEHCESAESFTEHCESTESFH
jgi:hypothetical protein